MNSIGGNLALFFIIWWTVLFAVLPFGVKSQAESGKVTEGTEPGAPAAPMLIKKALATTVVAVIVFAIVQFAIAHIEL